MAAAGIDPNNWDPAKGFEANKDNIKKVYALYASWYLQNPDLKWAGMAKLAGGSVYGGLLELEAQKDDWTGALGGGGAGVLLFPIFGLFGVVGGAIAGDSLYENRLETVEKIFVKMQQDIFLDLAWQHQAYLEGGLPALTAAYDRGEIRADLYDAWVKIATGDEAAKWEGNKELLYREQNRILPPGYAEIQDLFLGSFITDNISENTKSPIPGGKPFRELYPDGDVTVREERWAWINDHMLPEYKALGDEHTRALVAQPLDELAAGKFAPRPSP